MVARHLKKFTQRDGRKAQNNWARAMDKPIPFPDADEPLKPRAKPQNIEHQFQVAVMHWWHKNYARFGVSERALYAVPNAGKRGYALAAYEKAAGLRAGVPDLALDIARNGYHSMKIEMKQGDGKLNPEQREHHSFLLSEGYRVETHWTSQSAIASIEKYLLEDI